MSRSSDDEQLLSHNDTKAEAPSSSFQSSSKEDGGDSNSEKAGDTAADIRPLSSLSRSKSRRQRALSGRTFVSVASLASVLNNKPDGDKTEEKGTLLAGLEESDRKIDDEGNVFMQVDANSHSEGASLPGSVAQFEDELGFSRPSRSGHSTPNSITSDNSDRSMGGKLDASIARLSPFEGSASQFGGSNDSLPQQQQSSSKPETSKALWLKRKLGKPTKYLSADTDISDVTDGSDGMFTPRTTSRQSRASSRSGFGDTRTNRAHVARVGRPSSQVSYRSGASVANEEMIHTARSARMLRFDSDADTNAIYTTYDGTLQRCCLMYPTNSPP